MKEPSRGESEVPEELCRKKVDRYIHLCAGNEKADEKYTQRIREKMGNVGAEREMKNEDRGGMEGANRSRDRDQIKVMNTELQLLVLVYLLCIYSAVIVMDWSISEASSFDGRGSEDKFVVIAGGSVGVPASPGHPSEMV